MKSQTSMNMESPEEVSEFLDNTPKTFVVFSDQYWGRGKTLSEAARNCIAASGRAPAFKVVAYLILNDPEPSIDSHGHLHRSNSSSLIRIGKFFRVRDLARLEE